MSDQATQVDKAMRVWTNIAIASAPGDKRFYTNLLSAQLPDAEAAVLFHNGLSALEHETFKPLIANYALLQHVKDADILAPGIRGLHEASVYG